jgi:hypothetical protein
MSVLRLCFLVRGGEGDRETKMKARAMSVIQDSVMLREMESKP